VVLTTDPVLLPLAISLIKLALTSRMALLVCAICPECLTLWLSWFPASDSSLPELPPVFVAARATVAAALSGA
jgi:hypothetical protein